ncbi:MAG: helix-turn-helix domain-containing protein [Lachnospiraceae bacterium]|nr:helix-turn-helix domain-containing protein [Lachnospiraceae bacterium]
MKKKAANTISQNVKKYRLLNHMTQEALANALDLDTQYYAQLERGERNFTVEKIVRLCSLFHIGIENIIEVEYDEKENTNELCQTLMKEMEVLSFTQLSLVQKFIHEIVPYIK